MRDTHLEEKCLDVLMRAGGRMLSETEVRDCLSMTVTRKSVRGALKALADTNQIVATGWREPVPRRRYGFWKRPGA